MNKNKWRRGSYVTMSGMAVRSKQLLTYITLIKLQVKYILVQRILESGYNSRIDKNEYLGSISITGYVGSHFVQLQCHFAQLICPSFSIFVILWFQFVRCFACWSRTYHILLLKCQLFYTIVPYVWLHKLVMKVLFHRLHAVGAPCFFGSCW